MQGEPAMTQGIRYLSTILLAAGAIVLSPVRAATAEEGAAEAAQAFGRAILERDVDTQMKLLPATMYSKPGEREQERLRRLHDKERAVINGQKYLSFEVLSPSQTLKINKTTAVMLPYRSVLAMPEGKLRTESALIALAEEGSNRWSVFDASAYHTARSLKLVIPGYTAGLAVPPLKTKLIKGE
jgi:hypothetical protein